MQRRDVATSDERKEDSRSLLPLFDAVFPLLRYGRVRHGESASAADRAAPTYTVTVTVTVTVMRGVYVCVYVRVHTRRVSRSLPYPLGTRKPPRLHNFCEIPRVSCGRVKQVL